MRIGMICPYSLAVWGGVQDQVLGLSRALRAKGVNAQVLSPCDGPPPEPWVTPLGNSIPYAQNGSFAPLAPDPAAQLRVLAAIWDERFDVLHLHEPLAPGPTLTSVFVKPVPLLGTFHASGHIAAYRWGRPWVQRLAARIDHKVAVSPAAAEMAKSHLKGNYEVLFNGIEFQRYADVDPYPAGAPTVLFLGRHEPRKGLSVLLEASLLLGNDVNLWVAGHGPETDKLKARYGHHDHIQWLGPLSDLEKRQRLRGADVFCVPSVGGESFGVVLLEAMAAGTPVVASDIPAYRRVAADGEHASLVPIDDPPALAKALAEALRDPPDAVDRLERASIRAQQFSMDALAELYIARYEQILAARQN